jgi:hypothetical protein
VAQQPDVDLQIHRLPSKLSAPSGPVEVAVKIR